MICFFIFLLAVSRVLASLGDRNQMFQSCLSHCSGTGCAPYITEPHYCRQALACDDLHQDVPWELGLFQWSCEDDCKYQVKFELSLHPVASCAVQALAWYVM